MFSGMMGPLIHINPFGGRGIIPYRFSPYYEDNPRVVVMTAENLWSQWTDCSTTCGGGEQSRSRECYVDSAEEGSTYDCVIGDQEIETRQCYSTDCPIWGVWSSWSECNSPCSGGNRTRVKDCTDAEIHLNSDLTEFYNNIGRPDLICNGTTTVSLIILPVNMQLC